MSNVVKGDSPLAPNVPMHLHAEFTMLKRCVITLTTPALHKGSLDSERQMSSPGHTQGHNMGTHPTPWKQGRHRSSTGSRKLCPRGLFSQNNTSRDARGHAPLLKAQGQGLAGDGGNGWKW